MSPREPRRRPSSAETQALVHNWITPDWPAPSRVRACSTTRHGGVSVVPYRGLNLATHVGDMPEAVRRNRRTLMQALSLPTPPRWLRQVHGREVFLAHDPTWRNETVEGNETVEADACVTVTAGRVCAVLTADCVPILLSDRAATWVAAVHAGWRGLAANVIEAAVAGFHGPPEALLAWLGPAISRDHYQVGDEVHRALVVADGAAQAAFRPSPGGRWFADLYLLARQRLTRLGIDAIHGGGYCTYADARRFYSFRRDGTTGRMASLIWLEHEL